MIAGKNRAVINLLAIVLSLAVCSRAEARFSSGHSSHSSSSSHSFGSHSSFSSGHSYSSGSSSSSGSHSFFGFGHSTDRAASAEESHATFSHSGSSSSSGSSGYSGRSSSYSSSHYSSPSYSYEDARDVQIRSLRSELNWSQYQNRRLRFDSFFGGYYSRPYISYNDGYSPWFWLWLLDQNTNTQAYWAYNHQSTMDAARYQALLDQNQALQAQVTQLQAQQTPVDPTYSPPGLPATDMMYTDAVVNNAMNPPTSAAAKVFYTLCIFAGCCGLYWLFFVKRWSSL